MSSINGWYRSLSRRLSFTHEEREVDRLDRETVEMVVKLVLEKLLSQIELGGRSVRGARIIDYLADADKKTGGADGHRKYYTHHRMDQRQEGISWN
jgi:ATP-dependent protease HslVU (ClpYQ) ATPase subunit